MPQYEESLASIETQASVFEITPQRARLNLATTSLIRSVVILMHRIFAGLLAAALLAGPAAAGEIADKAVQAESLATDGKHLEAIDALNQAATSLWNKSPLSFRKVLWVAEPPGGFGVYNPRETNVYKAGDSMIAYGELVGHGWKNVGDIWQTDLAADVTIKTKDGKRIYSQKDFSKFGVSSRVRNREFMTQFTFTLNGIPAGEYVADVTLRDLVSGKKGMFSLPFLIN